MAKLPSFKRLNKNDYDPKYLDLIDRLAVSINSGFDSVYEALNKNLTLSNNILCSVVNITVAVNSSGVPNGTVIIPTSLATPVNVILVGRAINSSNPTGYPSSGVIVSWDQTTRDTITIKHITGLLPNNSYNLRLVMYGEEN